MTHGQFAPVSSFCQWSSVGSSPVSPRVHFLQPQPLWASSLAGLNQGRPGLPPCSRASRASDWPGSCVPNLLSLCTTCSSRGAQTRTRSSPDGLQSVLDKCPGHLCMTPETPWLKPFTFHIPLFLRSTTWSGFAVILRPISSPSSVLSRPWGLRRLTTRASAKYSNWQREPLD